MVELQAIDLNQHSSLKVQIDSKFSHAKHQNLVTLTVAEIPQGALNFPIFYTKDQHTGGFYCSALLGFKQNENLLYHPDEWHSSLIPMNISRGPFGIGPSSKNSSILTACINPNHPYIRKSDNSPLENSKNDYALFDTQGEETEFLRQTKHQLSQLFQRELETEQFTQALVKHNLLSPVKIRLNFAKGDQQFLSGFYSIRESQIRNLSDEIKLEFFNSGYIGPIYGLISSAWQIDRLKLLNNAKCNKNDDRKITEARLIYNS